MKLTRKVFYNKRNGQATIIIPSKEINKLQSKIKIGSKVKIGSKIEKISFEILNAKIGKGIK